MILDICVEIPLLKDENMSINSSKVNTWIGKYYLSRAATASMYKMSI